MIEMMVPVKDLVSAIDESADWILKTFNMPQMLAEKYDQCHPSFKTSIKRHGIKMPIECGYLGNTLTIVNGHHRLAVAHYHDLEEVPVIFGEGNNSAWDTNIPHSASRSPRYVNSDGDRDDG